MGSVGSTASCSPHDPRSRRGAVDDGRNTGLRVAVMLFLVAVVVSSGLFVLSLDDGGERNAENGQGRVSQDDRGLETVDEGDRTGTDDTGREVTGKSERGSGDGTGAGSRTPDVDVANLNETDVEELIVEIVNGLRRDREIEPVEPSSGLANVSRNHSANMSGSNYVAHVDPSGKGVVRYSERCESLRGYGNFSYSENIAQTWYGKRVESPDGNGTVVSMSEQDLAENIVDIWMNSSSHRDALLGDEWRTTGVGVVSNDSGAVFATQSFCSRG